MKRTREQEAADRAELWTIVIRSREQLLMPQREPALTAAELRAARSTALNQALAKCRPQNAEVSK